MTRPCYKNRLYGQEVLSNPYGHYYWDVAFQYVSFIPHGLIRPRDRVILSRGMNNLHDAVRIACRMAGEHAVAVKNGDDEFKEWPILNG